MVLKQTNHVFFHLYLMEEVLTLASLGGLDPNPGVQLKKIMKEVNGDIVVKDAQEKVHFTQFDQRGSYTKLLCRS